MCANDKLFTRGRLRLKFRPGVLTPMVKKVWGMGRRRFLVAENEVVAFDSFGSSDDDYAYVTPVKSRRASGPERATGLHGWRQNICSPAVLFPSLGKGVAASSIGCLLESRGFRVTLQKCDPYLNVDPGTMSPFQHGEVFVTEDGAETDLDLGHYERFTHAKLSRDNNWTTGHIYRNRPRQRAPRRLPGQNRAGDSARYRRD